MLVFLLWKKITYKNILTHSDHMQHMSASTFQTWRNSFVHFLFSFSFKYDFLNHIMNNQENLRRAKQMMHKGLTS